MAEKQATITLDGGRTLSMHYRVGTSDLPTIRMIWTERPYELARFRMVKRRLFIRERYAALISAGRTPLILDAGANIGASALFFADRFPRARIVAVEPEARNYELLRRNTEAFSNIIPVKGALASRGGVLRVSDPGMSHDAFRVGPIEPQESAPADLEMVEAFSVPDLLARHGQGGDLLLLKIDIEGGEADVFSSNTAWLEQTPAVVIELHDWLLPGQGTASNFLRRNAELGRDFIIAPGTDLIYSLVRPEGST